MLFRSCELGTWGAKSKLGAMPFMLTKDQREEFDGANIPEGLASILASNHARVADFFGFADANDDRSITKAELSDALLNKLRLSIAEADIEAWFSALDTNGDGVIDFGELKRGLPSSSRPATAKLSITLPTTPTSWSPRANSPSAYTPTWTPRTLPHGPVKSLEPPLTPPVRDPGFGFFSPRSPMSHEPLAPLLRAGGVTAHRKGSHLGNSIYLGHTGQSPSRPPPRPSRPGSARSQHSACASGLWPHQMDTLRSCTDRRHRALAGTALPWAQPHTQPRTGYYP